MLGGIQMNGDNHEMPRLSSLEMYRKQQEERQALLELQKRYESNQIAEEELTEKEKADLEKLYLEQISELKRGIDNIEKKVKRYD